VYADVYEYEEEYEDDGRVSCIVGRTPNTEHRTLNAP
jgi:hypothetical protein